MMLSDPITTRLIVHDGDWCLCEDDDLISGCTVYFVTNPYLGIEGNYLAILNKNKNKWIVVRQAAKNLLKNPQVPESIKLVINSFQLLDNF